MSRFWNNFRHPISDFLCPEERGKRLHPKRVKIHGVGSCRSVASIVAVLLTAKPRSHGFIFSRVKRLFSRKSCPTLGPTLSSNQSVPRVHSPRIKRPGQETGPGYEVKNERSYTSNFTTCLTEYTEVTVLLSQCHVLCEGSAALPWETKLIKSSLVLLRIF